MLRRAHENERNQPTNQSISQYEDTIETKLNGIALLSISEKINNSILFFWWNRAARTGVGGG